MVRPKWLSEKRGSPAKMMTCETLSDVRINPFLCPRKISPPKKIAAKQVLKNRPTLPRGTWNMSWSSTLHFQGAMPCCWFQEGWQVAFFYPPGISEEIWTENTRRSSSHHRIMTS